MKLKLDLRTYLTYILVATIAILTTSINALGQSKLVSKTTEKIECVTKFDTLLNRNYYIMADKMPFFQEGEGVMFRIIAKNLKWPNAECCIQGTVYVSFIVESNGRLSNKKIQKSPFKDNDFCSPNKEALKVLDYLPRWNAGICNGKKVAVLYILPIKFVLK
ncbi:energy transducer TonB [Pedobacter frigiditerrae]|uniref:energy transducer TonB n=1 Tax=Pedobacter frigiditerrae TaxID=2530452 RepID=UPI0029316A3C|nr:energy transducer TonB [Pedobacter frigiditerrae]